MIELLNTIGDYAWILLIAIIVVVIGFGYYLKRNNLKLDIKEVVFGPITATISDIPVKRMVFLSQPHDVSGKPAILPDIKIRVYGDENKPLSGKKVIIELNSYSGTDYLKGILEKKSDGKGNAVFSGLKISRVGQYELLAKSDSKFEISAAFEVTPPGLDIDFSNKPFGSREYKDTLARKLGLSKAGDDIRIDEEDI